MIIINLIYTTLDIVYQHKKSNKIVLKILYYCIFFY